MNRHPTAQQLTLLLHKLREAALAVEFDLLRALGGAKGDLDYMDLANLTGEACQTVADFTPDEPGSY